jgi:hypothetical protein
LSHCYQGANKKAQEIPVLLKSASSAISVLTNNPAPDLLPSTSIEDRKEAFATYDRAFHRALYKVQEELMWQVDVLQEAGLLVEKTPKVKEEITNGGLGGLDVGYLNSRARDVGIVKEGELVAEARKLAEKIVKGKKGETGGDDVMEE